MVALTNRSQATVIGKEKGEQGAEKTFELKGRVGCDEKKIGNIQSTN